MPFNSDLFLFFFFFFFVGPVSPKRKKVAARIYCSSCTVCIKIFQERIFEPMTLKKKIFVLKVSFVDTLADTLSDIIYHTGYCGDIFNDNLSGVIRSQQY